MTQVINNTVEEELTIHNKVLIGGLGALTPIIMNLLVVDLENLLLGITALAVIAYVIKVAILFYIGGLVAYLNKDENKPVKLFQLGIYAPAMILAFMNTNPFNANPPVPAEVNPTPPTEKEDKKDEDKNASIFALPSTIDFSAASASLVGIFQNDSTSRKMKANVKLLKSPMVRKATDSLWIDPLLEMIVKQNAPFLDTIAGNIATHLNELGKVQLKDPNVHKFKYPEETVTEQLLRGFFGWKSDRLWFVVIGKFETESEATTYAKLITQEMNKRQLSEVADLQGQIFIPQIYRPYGDMIPEYSVVIGKNLTFLQAQTVKSKIVDKKLNSIDPDNIEIWKLPIR